MTDPADCSEPDAHPTRETSVQNPHEYPEGQSRGLTAWVEALVAGLAPQSDSFTLRWTDDQEMTALNGQFRSKEGTTDVLSFPGEREPEGLHLGDVVISVPRAREQALAAGHEVDRELRILVLHGILHCMGYDHETDEGAMERLERQLRRKWVDEDV